MSKIFDDHEIEELPFYELEHMHHLLNLYCKFDYSGNDNSDLLYCIQRLDKIKDMAESFKECLKKSVN